ncbi:flagellar motor switch protein FliM [Frondihabitans australicus]|uniref:Flagellar motor switch protein FliM n=1 Tax=Frondihabitans australicus TaxID=386892 RepID=A0A495IHW1_9MICO|nr:flagellar motor switch protein FliM [Frondihabitans australicus]RKR75554.1 flagellar motor switch protein FliM [Frondihabitans australicus]
MTLLDQTAPGALRDAQAQPKSVDVYDFRRPTTLAREHSRVLELAFDTFARQWGTQLTAKVRVLSQVTCETVSMTTYDEFAASLPATTAMVLCPLEGASAKAVIQFPSASALGWVTHMLGGNPAGQSLPERKFTPVEQALVRRLMDDALEDLRYSLGSLLVAPISVGGFQYNSQFAQAASKSDLMIVASFEIRVGEAAAPATLALPAEVLLPQLGESNPTSTTVGARDLIDQQLAAVPVDVALGFLPARVLPSDVLDLKVGDLVALPHPEHRPLDVTVGGEPVGRAAVGANGSRLAGIIVTTEERLA